jgi:hypothetical protein
MRTFGKALTFLTLLVLALMPLQSAQARGLADKTEDGTILFGENFTLKSGETLKGDLVVFGGNVITEKDSTVTGAIIIFGGTLIADGNVKGDVVLIGGSMKLGEDCHIRGSVVTFGGAVDRADGAKIDGDIVNNPRGPVNINPDLPSVPEVPDVPEVPVLQRAFDPMWQGLQLFGQALILALLAALLVAFIPDHLSRVGQASSSQAVVAGGMGLLTLVLFPAALFTMIVTLILIPVAALAILLLAIAALYGWIAVGVEVGVRLVRMLNQNWALPISAMLGTFLMTIVVNGINFIPCIGWIAPFIVTIVGLGAVIMTRFGTRLAVAPAFVSAAPIPPAPAADETIESDQN